MTEMSEETRPLSVFTMLGVVIVMLMKVIFALELLEFEPVALELANKVRFESVTLVEVIEPSSFIVTIFR